jgi:hypothetical protein
MARLAQSPAPPTVRAGALASSAYAFAGGSLIEALEAKRHAGPSLLRFTSIR